MSSYLTLAAMLLMVMSPVLLPLMIGGVRMIANLFVKDQRPVANTGARTVALATAE